MIIAEVVTKSDDLRQLVNEINSAYWDDANEMGPFDANDLSHYLDHQGTVFVACHDRVGDRSTLLGIASARLEIKAYDREQWLYVDEVDVCADQRQRGAGKAIMRKLIAIAEDAGCSVVWLGTEPDNHAGNRLYQSLKPTDVAGFIGYTYEID